ncbi:uncharacterized protein LOC113559111 [Rhopalosiphum maidis]|uniref:uncharacterized protein LOC113559111 n=1 Tax=Rhopalosiphum maidis TaxID=43146 RepID=UPI000EFF0B3A|nr:uncharacterized protein LOC113559111 [Rhopalosiphum maidis]
MATKWWKIIALQILMTTIICSIGLELDDDSKLSNEKMISLFKPLLEDISNQHAIKDNEKIEKTKNLHLPLSLTLFNGKYFEKFLENDELKNEDLHQSTFKKIRNIRNVNSTDNANKKSRTNLCYFKLCGKRINDDHDKSIRNVPKRNNNPQ